jgi:thioredoxin 2
MFRSNDALLVIDFLAPWRGIHKGMAPAFDQAAKSLDLYIRLAKVISNVAQAVASCFRIKSRLALAAFYLGKDITCQNRTVDTASIVHWVEDVSR